MKRLPVTGPDRPHPPEPKGLRIVAVLSPRTVSILDQLALAARVVVHVLDERRRLACGTHSRLDPLEQVRLVVVRPRFTSVRRRLRDDAVQRVERSACRERFGLEKPLRDGQRVFRTRARRRNGPVGARLVVGSETPRGLDGVPLEVHEHILDHAHPIEHERWARPQVSFHGFRMRLAVQRALREKLRAGLGGDVKVRWSAKNVELVPEHLATTVPAPDGPVGYIGKRPAFTGIGRTRVEDARQHVVPLPHHDDPASVGYRDLISLDVELDARLVLPARTVVGGGQERATEGVEVGDGRRSRMP